MKLTRRTLTSALALSAAGRSLAERGHALIGGRVAGCGCRGFRRLMGGQERGGLVLQGLAVLQPVGRLGVRRIDEPVGGDVEPGSPAGRRLLLLLVADPLCVPHSQGLPCVVFSAAIAT